MNWLKSRDSSLAERSQRFLASLVDTEQRQEGQLLIQNLIEIAQQVNEKEENACKDLSRKKPRLVSPDKSLATSKLHAKVSAVSVQTPERKKCDVSLYSTHIEISPATSNDVLQRIMLKDIVAFIAVPTANKAVAHITYIISTKGNKSDLVFGSNVSEAVQLTHYGTSGPMEGKAKLSDNWARLVHASYPQFQVSQPSHAVFCPSKVRKQSGTSIHHVVAYSKAKDGFLYFLPLGLLYGFKKPVLYFPHTCIRGIDVHSITSRTFDISICYVEGESEEKHAVEFSMIDNTEFDGIESYIKEFQLSRPTINGETVQTSNYGNTDTVADFVGTDYNESDDEDYADDSTDRDGDSSDADSLDEEDQDSKSYSSRDDDESEGNDSGADAADVQNEVDD